MVFFFYFLFLGAKSKVLAPQWDIMAKRMSEAVRPSSSLQDEVHELDWALCGTTFTANLSEVRNPHLPVRMLIFNWLCVNSFAVLSNNVVSPKTRKGKTYAYPATPITWDATKVKYKSKKSKQRKHLRRLYLLQLGYKPTDTLLWRIVVNFSLREKYDQEIFVNDCVASLQCLVNLNPKRRQQ